MFHVSPLALSAVLSLAAISPSLSQSDCSPAFSADASYKPNDTVSVDSVNYKCVPQWKNYCSGAENTPPGTPGSFATVAWENLGECVDATVAAEEEGTDVASNGNSGSNGNGNGNAGGNSGSNGNSNASNGNSNSNANSNAGGNASANSNANNANSNANANANKDATTTEESVSLWNDDGGCPDAFVAGTAYDGGDIVSFNDMVYECKGGKGSPNWCQYENYEPEVGKFWRTAWKLLGACSGSMTPTPAPTRDAADFAGGCPEPFSSAVEYGAGDKVEVDGYVYECKGQPYSSFCSVPHHEPGTPGGKLGWENLGWCEGSMVPTASPTRPLADFAGGCPDDYVEGAKYRGGDKITLDGKVYQCQTENAPFCNMNAFRPGSNAASATWIELGWCDGSMGPTMSPTRPLDDFVGGCPDEYSKDTKYEEGDKVTKDGKVYQCEAGKAPFCKAAAFTPGTFAGASAWVELGWCDGSGSPTASPTFDPNTPGCPDEYVPGTPYEEGDKVSIGSKVYLCEGKFSMVCKRFGPQDNGGPQAWTDLGSCTGSIAPTSSPTFDPNTPGCPDAYVPGTRYEEGDKVAVGSIVYSCEGDFAIKCKNFGPEEFGGSQAWTKVGACTGTIGPTASPTFDPDTPGCPDPYDDTLAYDENDKVSIDNVAYQCTQSAYCVVFGPTDAGGILGWTSLGPCVGSLAPTASPTFDADTPGCPEDYVAGTPYVGGDRVAVDNVIYQCKKPHEAHCPNRVPGDQGEDDDAWIRLGVCSGTIAPTPSPTVDLDAPGCPEEYDPDTEYASLDKALVDGIVYMCRPNAYSAFCNAGPAYAPGGSNSDLGWVKQGGCRGTIAPTASP